MEQLSSSSSLDDEISDLQAKISQLKSQLSLQTSTLLTSPSTRQLIILPSASVPSSSSPSLAHTISSQLSHAQQSLYRACATVTTFRARDPDPRSVDSGSILGLRVDVMSRTKFLRPYYVFLNRPYLPRSKHLRVHRHTIPDCIPLAGLAGRYLPPPSTGTTTTTTEEEEGGEGAEGGGGEDGKGKQRKGEGGRERGRRQRQRQDLVRFARTLRREVVRYHHRMGVVADLRKAAGDEIADISVADAEAKQVTFEWADGRRTGRLVMGDDGEILKLVVVGEDGGRDRETGRELLGGAVDAQEVVRRLAAAAAAASGV